MKPIPDQKQRSAAVLTEGHALVWASAGTGKTHTLTLRALYLLLTAPSDKRAADTECARLFTAPSRVERMRSARAVVRRLVLTTFTRKAAAEMQTRLYEYLDAVSSAENLDALRARFAEKDPQLIEVVETALKRISDFQSLRQGAEALAELATELQVCTLHSFAAAILRRHPVAAGIPPTAQFAEDDDATLTDIPAQVVERWWQRVVTDPALSRELAELAKVVPIQDMRDWLQAIFKAPWIVTEMAFEKPKPGLLREMLGACELVANHPKAMSLVDVVELRAVLQAKPFSWEQFGRLIHEKRTKLFLDRLREGEAKKLREAIASLSPAQRAWFASHKAIYPIALAQCLNEERGPVWAAWRRFVTGFAAWAEGAAVRELGIVTFDDMARLAARLFRANESVRREERGRLWAILVDEFQDTDLVQLDLIEQLLRRDSAGDHEVVGFFVGDRKQSIYRFRDVDLPAIEAFVARYPKIVHCGPPATFQLTASFRSIEPITKFVNELFGNHVKLPGYAAEQLEAVRRDAGPLPEWRLLNRPVARGQTDEGRELAAWETARLIEEYRAAPGKDDKAYRDIVALVRTHDELDALLSVLERAGIPVVSSGAKTFYQQPEVLDVLNLLIAAHNPLDALAVGALLRSPLFGVSDRQIHALLERVKPSALFRSEAALPDDLPATARQRIESARSLVRERLQTALADWLRQVREFIPASVYARQNTEGRAVARIDNVLTAFRRAVELGAMPPLAWLLEQRARGRETFDANFGEDVSVTDESMAAVRAMTVHKAKGLQGKFVIVYGWQKTLDKLKPERSRDNRFALTGCDGASLRGYQLDWGPLRIVSPSYFAAEALNEEYEVKEAGRLAYVTATRAQDRLVLLSPHTGEIADGRLAEAQPALKAGASSTTVFGGTLQVTLVEPREGQPRERAVVLRIQNQKAYADSWMQRAAALAQSATPLLHRPSKPERIEEEDAADVEDYVRRKIELAQETARQAGTLAHRYLERHLRDESFDDARLDAIAAADPSARPGPAAIARARAALERFFGSPIHQRARQAKILGREVPVSLTDAGKAWSGVMDLVLEESGMVVGVDYKLSEQPSSLPAEYRNQERIYTEVLRRLFPAREVRFEFWWLG